MVDARDKPVFSPIKMINMEDSFNTFPSFGPEFKIDDI